MSKQYTVKTPNTAFTGVRAGVQFTDGVGKTDKNTAAKLVNLWGYSCAELESSNAKEYKTDPELPEHSLNEDHPALELLVSNGFDTPEKVQEASDEALRAVNGIGPKALKEIREFNNQAH